jgi:sulfite oxidase
MTEKHYHAWRLWTIKLPLDAEGWIELVVRAWDSANNTQPTFVRSAWKYVLSSHRPIVPLSPIPPFQGLYAMLSFLNNAAFSWDLHVTSSAHRIKIYSVNTSRAATRRRIELMREHGVESFEPLSRPLEFSLEDEQTFLEKVRRYPREPKS